MRKIVLAVAWALAAPTAFAQGSPTQSGVELYGIIDVGIEHVDNGPGVSATKVTSGMSTGSRWGVRGNEDLGRGYRALFTLENRFEADTGQLSNSGPLYYCGKVAVCPGVTLLPPATALPAANQAAILGGSNAVNAGLLSAVSIVNSPGAIFDRQAFAGLVTPFGAVLLGRQYTPNYEVLVKYNSFADSFAGNPGQLATINIRANNTVQYRAELSGFTLSAMYGFGGAEGTAGGRGERTTAPTKGDDFMGINVQYNTAQFGVGAGYNQNRTVTYAAPNENRKGLETFSVGGFAVVGPTKLFAEYLKSKNDNPVLRPEDVQGLIISTGGNLAAINSILGSLFINRFDVNAIRGLAGPTDAHVYHLGLQWKLGAGTILAAYNSAKDTSRSAWATGDASVDSIGLVYTYDLSKRSMLYAGGAVANNKDQARIALGSACCVGGWTTSPGEDSRAIQVGMRHTF
jgi:predicted porin